MLNVFLEVVIGGPHYRVLKLAHGSDQEVGPATVKSAGFLAHYPEFSGQ